MNKTFFVFCYSNYVLTNSLSLQLLSSSAAPIYSFFFPMRPPAIPLLHLCSLSFHLGHLFYNREHSLQQHSWFVAQMTVAKCHLKQKGFQVFVLHLPFLHCHWSNPLLWAQIPCQWMKVSTDHLTGGLSGCCLCKGIRTPASPRPVLDSHGEPGRPWGKARTQEQESLCFIKLGTSAVLPSLFPHCQCMHEHNALGTTQTKSQTCLS